MVLHGLDLCSLTSTFNQPVHITKFFCLTSSVMCLTLDVRVTTFGSCLTVVIVTLLEPWCFSSSRFISTCVYTSSSFSPILLIIRWCNSGSVTVSLSICSKYPKTYCRAVTFELDFGRPSFLFLLVYVALSTTKKYFPFRNRSLHVWWYRASSAGRSFTAEMRDCICVAQSSCLLLQWVSMFYWKPSVIT